MFDAIVFGILLVALVLVGTATVLNANQPWEEETYGED